MFAAALFGVSDRVRQSPETHKPKNDASVRKKSLLHGGEQPAGDVRPRPAVDDRLPGGLPQHVVLGWRKCEHVIQLVGEIGRIAGLEGC